MSQKQQEHLAAVAIQQWWVQARAERLRRLGEHAAATAVQAAWRGRAARAEVALLKEQLARERRAFEVCPANSFAMCREESYHLDERVTADSFFTSVIYIAS